MIITVCGIAQGVGFQASVHRVATRLGMHYHIQINDSHAVIQIDGDVDRFVSELRQTMAPLACLDSVEISTGMFDGELSDIGFQNIKRTSSQKAAGIPNDVAGSYDCCQGYGDLAAREYQPQTIPCTDRESKFRLLDSDGNMIGGEPISTFATLLEQGSIGVAKGSGGMHLCCTLGTLPRMRQRYRRRVKPFAIMVRDMEAVRK